MVALVVAVIRGANQVVVAPREARHLSNGNGKQATKENAQKARQPEESVGAPKKQKKTGQNLQLCPKLAHQREHSRTSEGTAQEDEAASFKRTRDEICMYGYAGPGSGWSWVAIICSACRAKQVTGAQTRDK